jgi:hypothetical protein
MRLSLCALLVALFLPACSPQPPPHAVQLAALPPQPGNSPPPPSRDFAQTVQYIDAGVKYIDPINAFFVVPRGGMCFRGVAVADERYPIDQWNVWCIDAHMVASVDALANDVSYVPQVRLWCKHANPYCAQRIGEPQFPLFGSVGFADSITVSVVPAKKEKAAIEHLVRLLGGRLDAAGPLD